MINRNLFLFAAVLLAASLACNFALGGDSTSEPAATEAAAQPSGPGPSSLDLDDPNTFQEIPGSYTLAMEFRFEATHADGSPVNGQVSLSGANQAEPPASSYVFTATGEAEIDGSQVFQAVSLPDRAYFYTNEAGCITFPASQAATPYDALVDTGGFLTGTAQRTTPDSEINGVAAYQFTLTQDNLNITDPDSMEVTAINDGAIFVAKDGGYVLRLVLEGRGLSELLSGDPTLEGDMFYQLDFTPVDDVGEIRPPLGCEEGDPAPDSEFPVMIGATKVASFEGFLSYEVSADRQSVVDFYVSELAATGWILIEENTVANISALRFSQGERTVSVIVTFDADANVSTVVVGEEQ